MRRPQGLHDLSHLHRRLWRIGIRRAAQRCALILGGPADVLRVLIGLLELECAHLTPQEKMATLSNTMSAEDWKAVASKAIVMYFITCPEQGPGYCYAVRSKL